MTQKTEGLETSLPDLTVDVVAAEKQVAKANAKVKAVTADKAAKVVAPEEVEEEAGTKASNVVVTDKEEKAEDCEVRIQND